MGWFFGFKLHVVNNHRGEFMAIKITPCNTDERTPLEQMVAGLEGKLLADNGYISNKRIRLYPFVSPRLQAGQNKN